MTDNRKTTSTLKAVRMCTSSGAIQAVKQLAVSNLQPQAIELTVIQHVYLKLSTCTCTLESEDIFAGPHNFKMDVFKVRLG